METLKHIWKAPWTVKLSLLFFAFIYLVALIGNPGYIIYITLVLAALFRIVSWILNGE